MKKLTQLPSPTSIFAIGLMFLSVIFLTGCLRGETKTLTEVFEISRQKFITASKDNSSLSPEASASVSSLSTLLEDLVNQTSNSKALVLQIEQNLSTLLPMATYTVRPSLTEVRNQFLEASAQENITAAQAKMLAARVYNLIGDELSQGKFSIK